MTRLSCRSCNLPAWVAASPPPTKRARGSRPRPRSPWTTLDSADRGSAGTRLRRAKRSCRSRRRVSGSVLGLTESARRDRGRAPHRRTGEADAAHGSALTQRIERALVSPTEPMPSFMRLPPERFRALVAFLTLLVGEELGCPGQAVPTATFVLIGIRSEPSAVACGASRSATSSETACWE